MLELSSIELKNKYIVQQNNAKGLLKERLISLGIVENSFIYKIKKGKGISIYLIRGMMLALRDEEAKLICVKSV